jgi:hypothetical protein
LVPGHVVGLIQRERVGEHLRIVRHTSKLRM